jgi:acetylornithine deacetylase/succinyl-diaminopimelate desuccinylase-like protein
MDWQSTKIGTEDFMLRSIDVFYQGEGIQEFEHIEVSDEHSFSAVKMMLAEKHGLGADVLLFIEDCDEPADEALIVDKHAGSCGVKVHVHRCRHIEVTVSFNGETVHHRFGPGSTIARVKRWSAGHKFGMSPEEASEHVLQISGSHDRPVPGTHLGVLAACPHCRIAFDLVPDQRVNGSAKGEAIA